jgi:hypothetical protein
MLQVEPVRIEEIARGDVVCFPGDRETVVAHRVIGRTGDVESRLFAIRGDAQEVAEHVPAAAIAYVVTRVEHPLFSYDTRGVLGRCIARFALRHGVATRRAGRVVRAAYRAGSMFKTVVLPNRFHRPEHGSGFG